MKKKIEIKKRKKKEEKKKRDKCSYSISLPGWAGNSNQIQSTDPLCFFYSELLLGVGYAS